MPPYPRWPAACGQADRHIVARMPGALLIAMASLMFCCGAAAQPVTYRAQVVTDVRLDKSFYHNAALTLTFAADTGDAGPALDPSGNPVSSGVCNFASFFWITKGQAALTIESHGEVIEAAFLPNQLFVAADICAGGIGIGSYVASGLEPGYPLSFTRGSSEYYAGGNNNVFAPTFQVSGNAFSCIGYASLDGPGGACASPDGYPLHTDRGDFFVYMPYTGWQHNAMRTYSLNRGTFSAVPRVAQDDQAAH